MANNWNGSIRKFYQLDSKGKVREWTIEVQCVTSYLSKIVITSGLEDGKKIETITDITEGLNIGKINATTPFTQALADSDSEINKKVKQGYSEDRNNLKGKTETATIKKPMKAETYKPNPESGQEKKSYTLDRAGIRSKKVFLQRKYDGWRFRIKVEYGKCTFYTSSGDITLGFDQIEESLLSTFHKNYKYWNEKYGVTEHILDGEIFNLEKGFYLSASACASIVNITPEKQALRDKMQFHVFDAVIDDPTVLYETRQKIIGNYIDNKFVMPVESIEVIADEKIIDEYMAKFLSEGYEGLMIKVPGTPYEFKRSKYVFKYKPFEDDEFEIVGFKKSITGETLGSFQCKMPNGKTFFANPKDDFGKDETKLEIWKNKEKYLGKFITVTFMGIGPEDPKDPMNTGLPRHPRAKCFRKGPSKD